MTEQEQIGLMYMAPIIIALCVILVIGIFIHIVIGWCLHNIAKDRGEPTWMSWAPVFNVALLLKLNKRNPWLSLLSIVPYLSIVFAVYLLWVLYKLGEEYNCNKILFFIGIPIPFCMLAFLIEMALNAKNRAKQLYSHVN